MAGSYVGFFLRYLKLLILKNQTLGGTVERMARTQGSATCIRFGEQHISYEAFNRAANRRANLFLSLGVRKGETVALLMENRPEFVETLTGLAKLGAVAAAINTNLVGPALIHCLNLSGASRIVVGRECLPQLTDVLSRLATIRADGVFVDSEAESRGAIPTGGHDLNAMLSGASEARPPAIKLTSQDALMYIYTSGTTGLPKAARITHYRWVAAGLGMGNYCLAVEKDDVLYCALPLYHSNGALIALGSAFVNGAAFALSRRFSASRFWEEATRLEATCFIYIGELLRYLMNTPAGPADRTHKVTRILGNGLRPDIWVPFQERFNIPHIREFYASSEGNAVTVNLNDAAGSMGTPILKSSDNLAVVRFDVETNAYLRDANGFCQRTAPGEAGELLGQITFTTPFHGYTNPADTEKKLLRDVFKKGDVFFKTGDLVKRDAAGNYYFVDRIGDTFRWKGENVATQEVQEILSGFPGLHMINVFGVRVPGSEGRVGMAALMFDPDVKFSPERFFAYAEEHLPSYARPAFVRLVENLEVTGTYKLKKTDLQMAGYDPSSVKDPLYVKDEEKKAFVRLTPALYASVQAEKVRI